MSWANFVGRVPCEATVENALDAGFVLRGDREAVRAVHVPDAAADAGPLPLGLPTALFCRLGLDEWGSTRRGRRVGPARLTILGRDIALDAVELADDSAVVVGRIPLEHLQLVLDPATGRLAHSPATGGQWVLDLFPASAGGSKVRLLGMGRISARWRCRVTAAPATLTTKG